MKLINVIKKSLFTAVIGLFAGFVLGLVIWGMTLFVSSSPDMPTRELAAFLGMAAGAVLGAVFGGIVGLKEK
jgi:NhaP-type Na+/H+ or K+/H+ antiporter